MCVDEEPLLRLTVSYEGSRDHQGQYMAVDESEIKVFAAKDGGVPLFRYEYLREAVRDMPADHLQVHAHRDSLANVMGRAGRSTRRGKRRSDRDQVSRLEELHFPLGGHRFRPCLEDVLEMLVSELGVDSTPDGRRALLARRERWRRTQIRSVVRDAPGEAVAVLQALGYEVTWPSTTPHPRGNPGRLHDF